MTDDLGFFAAAPARPAADPTPFGTPAVPDLPFGTPAPAQPGTVTPPAAGSGRTKAVIAFVVVGTVALLALGGVLAVRTWRGTGFEATANRTSVSTPATIGSFARSTSTAPTLAQLVPDLTAAAPLRTPLLATYADGAVTAEVLTAEPAAPMDSAALGRLTAAFAAGVERVTGMPPELAPAGLSLSAPLSCSQVELGDSVAVACVSTSSGSVTAVLVSGQDFQEAGRTAATLRAGVVHQG